MPLPRKYKPSHSDKIRAYRLYKKEGTQKEIAIHLGISLVALKGAWDSFEEFFERKEASLKVKLSRIPVGRPKGDRILDGFPLVNAETLHMLAICGYTIPTAAKTIGVAHNTLRTYLAEHPDLQQAFQSGAAIADSEVMMALKARACGMSLKRVKFATFEGAITDSQDYLEDLPPDTSAAAMWLINRKRWTRDSEGAKADNKGRILEALDKLTETPESELDQMDSENEQELDE